MAAFKRAVRRYGLNEALAIERLERLERSRSGCAAFSSCSLFIFSTKFRLPTAIASDIAAPSRRLWTGVTIDLAI